MLSRYYIVYLICLILFGLFCYAVSRAYNLPGDLTISSWFTGINTSSIDGLMGAVSGFGETITEVITVCLLVLALLLYKKKLEAIFVVLLTSLVAILTWLLKIIIERPRPSDELVSDGGLSFPSGHVSYIVVLFGFLLYVLPRLIRQRIIRTALQVIMIIMILFMMASRIYLGEHWPSDVLGGAMLAGLILVPLIIVYKKYNEGGKGARVA
ncbi:MAG: phosphatase PAP2 family protein [Dehalococcoidia bacterium]|nr:MAG: phosphatase PAP2 family protein [Dehalococcoidia bacterium]